MGIDIKKGQKLPSGGYEVDHTTNVIAVPAARATSSGRPARHRPTWPPTSHKILKADS